MKIKVSEYIANFFVENNINQVFTVVGGGAMHLNNSFGHNTSMNCIYNHHEQASAIAAEGYAKMTGKPAICCITSGPGAINALNGVAGAYQDSTPMIVLSGQVKSSLTVRKSGLKLRTLGGQEFDIVSAVGNMTKFAEMIDDPLKIRSLLEKMLFVATNGRPGPCWLDIPLDVQGAIIDTDQLKGWEGATDSLLQTEYDHEDNRLRDADLEKEIKEIVEKLRVAKRPVIYAGNGIRIAGAYLKFIELVHKLNIPVVTCWDSIDLIGSDDRCYCGRGGTMGDRAGNFAVQNSDLLISIGARLGIYQVGYNVNTWARAAYTVVVDIDSEELKKPILRADKPICADADEFIEKFIVESDELNGESYSDWVEQCNNWKAKYPVVTENEKKDSKPANVYAFMDALSKKLSKNAVTVVTNGSASVVGSAAYYIKQDDRFIMNCGLSSMGYGLPAAIGAGTANNKMPVVCIEGDGSVMMNLQELQTVVTNRIPIKLFIINNNGYHQIRLTQKNIFNGAYVGLGPESGDLGFPDFSKIADAFGIKYFSADCNSDLSEFVKDALNADGACLCEVFVTTDQKFEPKSATKKLDDGTLVSPPLEDLAPFLSREELKENMYIPLIEEK